MATLALFDFDHTLYKKDSLLEFTKFHHGSSFYLGILKLMPHLLLMKIGLLSNEDAKIRYFTHFFEDTDYAEFSKSAARFANKKISADIDRTIFAEFQQHLKSGHEVLIVTASMPEWIQPWSEQYNVKVIGTLLETINGKLTGKFSSVNCNGKAKADRIMEVINLSAYSEIAVYGNGKGDREMMKLAKPIK